MAMSLPFDGPVCLTPGGQKFVATGLVSKLWPECVWPQLHSGHSFDARAVAEKFWSQLYPQIWAFARTHTPRHDTVRPSTQRPDTQQTPPDTHGHPRTPQTTEATRRASHGALTHAGQWEVTSLCSLCSVKVFHRCSAARSSSAPSTLRMSQDRVRILRHCIVSTECDVCARP